LVDLVIFRLKDQITDLVVERKPRDVKATMTHRQSVLARPRTAAVGLNRHPTLLAARSF